MGSLVSRMVGLCITTVILSAAASVGFGVFSLLGKGLSGLWGGFTLTPSFGGVRGWFLPNA
jgi:hypothetical protein